MLNKLILLTIGLLVVGAAAYYIAMNNKDEGKTNVHSFTV